MARINIDAGAILGGYKKRCFWCYPIPLSKPVCRDVNDDAVLACALAANADFIVSGDDDLLSLHAFEDIPIITPSSAIKLLNKS